jgi:hypothetical protein
MAIIRNIAAKVRQDQQVDEYVLTKLKQGDERKAKRAYENWKAKQSINHLKK